MNIDIRLILLVLCIQNSAVIASLAAAPFEYAYLWYAYRLQWEVGGEAAVTIAKGLEPRDPTLGATLDEFVQYIEEPPGFGGDTAIGTNVKPDIDTIASELSKKLGGRGPVFGKAHIDFKKLLDDPTTAMSQLASVLEWVRDQITETRRVYSVKDDAFELVKMRSALDRVITTRRDENIKPLKNTLEAYFANKGHATDVDVVVRPTEDGPKLMWEDTINTLRNGYSSDDFVADAESYFADIQETGKAPGKGPGKAPEKAGDDMHHRTIMSFEAARDDLLKSVENLPCKCLACAMGPHGGGMRSFPPPHRVG